MQLAERVAGAAAARCATSRASTRRPRTPRRWRRWRSARWRHGDARLAPCTNSASTSPLGRIAGLRAGTPGAPKVLALHGWLDNAASFVPLAPRLHGIELVAPDLPGHGRSAHLPPGADYSFAGAVNSVLDIADALGWERFAAARPFDGRRRSAACSRRRVRERVERFVAIEALGALAEAPERTVTRLRDAIAATRALAAQAAARVPRYRHRGARAHAGQRS